MITRILHTGKKRNQPTGTPPVYNAPTVEGVVFDFPTAPTANGLRYNGFFYTETLNDNSIFYMWKLSSSHPAGEIIMMARSLNGGITKISRQAKVNGVTVGGTNLVCSKVTVAGVDYIYFGRQTDSQNVEISRCPISTLQNNFNTASFSVVDNHDFGASGFLCGTKSFTKLSNGDILLPYFFQETSHGYCALLKSTDGTTFTPFSTIYERFTDDIPVEPCIIETTPGTIVAVMRRYNTSTLGANYFYHAKSTDYGATWTTNVDPVLYLFGNVSDGNPIDLAEHNGLIYMINCNRKLPIPFKIEYATSSIADFEANNESGYSAINIIDYTVNASRPPFNVPIDFGYGVHFKRNGELWIVPYDISGLHTSADESNGRRTWGYQIKIAGSLPPPSITVARSSTTAFAVTVDGYTSGQLAAIDHFEIDVAYDPSYRGYVTGTMNLGTSVLQERTFTGTVASFTSMPELADNLYIRIRAVYGHSSSDWTDWSKMPTGVARTGIVSLGGSLWNGYTDDFNTIHSFEPGDYIPLESGSYNDLLLFGKFDTVWFVGPATGQAVIEYFGFGDYAKHIKIVAHPDNPTGVKIKNANGEFVGHFAITCRTVGDCFFRDVQIEDCRMGPQIETRLSVYANLAAFPGTGAFDHNYKALDTGNFYIWNGSTYEAPGISTGIPLDYQNAVLINVSVNGTYYEGLYNGADLLSPIPTNTFLRNYTTNNTGRDGVQHRNGLIDADRVTITNYGLNSEDPHGHGLTLGAGPDGFTGGVVKNFSIGGTGRYYGVFTNVKGPLRLENGVIDAPVQSGIFFKNYETVAGDSQTLTLRNVRIGNPTVGTYALDVERDPAKGDMIVNIHSDTTFSTIHLNETVVEIAPGIFDGGVTRNDIP